MEGTEETEILEHLARSRAALAWVQAGFSRAEAAAWAEAGWTDPGQAARWKATSPLSDPGSLHELSTSGYSPDQVGCTARFAPRFATAWTRACTGDTDPDGMDGSEHPRRRASDHDPLEALFAEADAAIDAEDSTPAPDPRSLGV